jgi:dUTP pyrophosphatase
MKVRYKKLVERAVEPSYSRPGDAGLDLTAIGLKIDPKHNYIQYFTGLAFEIPEGYVGLVFPRSSNREKDLTLANAVGVIDSNYRGEISLCYKFDSDEHFGTIKKYKEGDRVGQLVIIPYPQIELEVSNTLSDTVRGEEGYGSSGK